MANKTYKVKRVVDVRFNKATGDKEAKLRWSGYAKERDHTWRSVRIMKKSNLKNLLVLYYRFVAFKKLKGNENKTQGDFESTLCVKDKVYGASMKANCVVVALRVAAKLLELPGYCSPPTLAKFKSLGKGLTTNMPWETIQSLITFCNREQRLSKLPSIQFKGKKDSMLKAKYRGYVDWKFSPGVYFCGAYDKDGVGHCFILQGRDDGTFFYHDPEIGKQPVQYQESTALWIKSWNFFIPFIKRTK